MRLIGHAPNVIMPKTGMYADRRGNPLIRVPIGTPSWHLRSEVGLDTEAVTMLLTLTQQPKDDTFCTRYNDCILEQDESPMRTREGSYE